MKTLLGPRRACLLAWALCKGQGQHSSGLKWVEGTASGSWPAPLSLGASAWARGAHVFFHCGCDGFREQPSPAGRALLGAGAEGGRGWSAAQAQGAFLPRPEDPDP